MKSFGCSALRNPEGAHLPSSYNNLIFKSANTRTVLVVRFRRTVRTSSQTDRVCQHSRTVQTAQTNGFNLYVVFLILFFYCNSISTKYELNPAATVWTEVEVRPELKGMDSQASKLNTSTFPSFELVRFGCIV